MIDKIKELHQIGVKTVPEVNRHLNDYVTNKLFGGKQPPPVSQRRFYPITNDIRNILNAQRSGDRKATDQENLRIKCEKWQQENPDDSIFYRVNSRAFNPLISRGLHLLSKIVWH